MKMYSQIIAKGLLLATIILFLSSVNTKAETLTGISVSAGSWQTETAGDVSHVGPNINLQDDLDIDDQKNAVFSFSFEHLFYAIPNIKIQRANLDTQSSKILTSDINFGGMTYLTNSSVNSQVDLSHTDYIVYYELLDNWLSLDLGMTVMNFDGKIQLQSANQVSDVALDEYIPAVYGKVNLALPTTGMSIGAESSSLAYGDNSITDYKIYLGWETNSTFGAEVGYHSFNADWEDLDSSDGDVSFDGYYATVTFHF